MLAGVQGDAAQSACEVDLSMDRGAADDQSSGAGPPGLPAEEKEQTPASTASSAAAAHGARRAAFPHEWIADKLDDTSCHDDLEYEADLYGAYFVSAAGYPVGACLGYLGFLERLRDGASRALSPSTRRFVEAHPDAERRSERLLRWTTAAGAAAAAERSEQEGGRLLNWTGTSEPLALRRLRERDPPPADASRAFAAVEALFGAADSAIIGTHLVVAAAATLIAATFLGPHPAAARSTAGSGGFAGWRTWGPPVRRAARAAAVALTLTWVYARVTESFDQQEERQMRAAFDRRGMDLACALPLYARERGVAATAVEALSESWVGDLLRFLRYLARDCLLFYALRPLAFASLLLRTAWRPFAAALFTIFHPLARAWIYSAVLLPAWRSIRHPLALLRAVLFYALNALLLRERIITYVNGGAAETVPDRVLRHLNAAGGLAMRVDAYVETMEAAATIAARSAYVPAVAAAAALLAALGRRWAGNRGFGGRGYTSLASAAAPALAAVRRATDSAAGQRVRAALSALPAALADPDAANARRYLFLTCVIWDGPALLWRAAARGVPLALRHTTVMGGDGLLSFVAAAGCGTDVVSAVREHLAPLAKVIADSGATGAAPVALRRMGVLLLLWVAALHQCWWVPRQAAAALKREQAAARAAALKRATSEEEGEKSNGVWREAPVEEEDGGAVFPATLQGIAGAVRRRAGAAPLRSGSASGGPDYKSSQEGDDGGVVPRRRGRATDYRSTTSSDGGGGSRKSGRLLSRSPSPRGDRGGGGRRHGE